MNVLDASLLEALKEDKRKDDGMVICFFYCLISFCFWFWLPWLFNR